MGSRIIDETVDLLRTTTELVREREYYQIISAQVIVWGLLDPVSSFTAMTALGGASQEANPVVRNMLVMNPNMWVFVKAAALIAVVILAIEGEKYIRSFKYWRGWMHMLLWVGLFVVLKNFFAAFIAVT